MTGKSFAILFAAATLATSVPASAGPDIPEPKTSLVVSGGPPRDGRYVVGLQILLPAGWHTYWRNPGEAGIPPVFDESGSDNLSAVAVGFPAPERWSDGTSTSIVYHDRVVFPLTVTPADPARPVALRIGLDFGFCEVVCVPVHAALEANLDPGSAVDASASALIRSALDSVPAAEADAPHDAPRLSSVERIGDDPATAVLRIAVDSADPDAVDLFAEPPEGWYLAVPRKVGTEESYALFDLPLKGMPKSADFEGAPFRFTIVEGSLAVEAVRALD